MKRTVVALVALLGLLAVSVGAQATVLRVVVVQTSDAAAYLKDLDTIRANFGRLGSKATLRAWRARFAGPDAGAIVVAVEYPDMAAFAADDAKLQSDTAMSTLLRAMDGRRKILSDSLYEEMK